MELIKNLELNPFLRTIWVSQKAKDTWELPIQRCSQLVQELEIDSVQKGHRLCAWRSIQLRDIPGFTKYCNDKGLIVLPVKLVGNWGQGFAHKTPQVKSNEPNPLVYCIISRNLHDAVGYRDAFNDGDNVVQGEYLGFPDCCIKFFDENWKVGYFDPIFQIAMNSYILNRDLYYIITNSSHPLSNPLLRYVGVRIGFHIPCSFNCKKTIEIAEQRLKLINEIKGFNFETKDSYMWGKSLEKILIALLSMSMSWEVYHSIAIIRTPIFYIITNSLPTSQKYTVKLKGTFTPRESVKGTIFPFRGL